MRAMHIGDPGHGGGGASAPSTGNGMPSRRHTAWRDAPVWASAFRPFFAFGTAYGIGAMALFLALYVASDTLGVRASAATWHAHEMVFGFAGAIILGMVLTALPSWAKVREIAGGELALLVVLWLAGRIATLLSPLLAPWIVAATDASVWLVTAALVAPMLIGSHAQKFAIVLPVLCAMAGLDAWFHLAEWSGAAHLAARALDSAVALIALLFSLVGGFMTPVFTGNAVREAGRPVRVFRHGLLEVLALVSALAFVVAVAAPLPAPANAAIGALAAVIHGLRLAGWRGWQAKNAPLVLGMHIGYAWLVLTFLLFGAAHGGWPISAHAWVHAFTVGAVGTMMLALMPRVALRHTGRPVRPRPVVLAAMALMSAAALLRLFGETSHATSVAVAVSGALWLFGFAAYAACHGRMLLRKSLPRTSVAAPPP